MRQVIAIWILAIIAGVTCFGYIGQAIADDTKYDGACTGLETVGRCADKCADPGEFVRGYDKETGAVVCGKVTGCPYGDSIPLGPECDKLAPAPAAQDLSTNLNDSDTSTSSYDWGGK